MSKYRNNLPQLSKQLFLSDGGLETTLIFHDNIDLPYFAAFDVLKTVEGTKKIEDYFRTYIAIATSNKVGYILESPTWRASSDWGKLLGYSPVALDVINKQSIEMLSYLREELETQHSPMVISGCIGPRGDGYNPDEFMTIEEAQSYHTDQIKSFAESDCDLITALTLTYPEEAIGITLAAQSFGIPTVIAFTVETDGNLPNGQSLKEAIEKVDEYTDSAPVYYMINCAHPEHFESKLNGKETWISRIKGIRANASNKSHAELDECETLDDGNPDELAHSYQKFNQHLDNLNIFGGCCGTDHRHVEAICRATLSK